MFRDRREIRTHQQQEMAKIITGAPIPGAGTSAGQEANQPAVDARSLGARPEETQGSLRMRNLRSSPLRGNNGSQQRPPRDESARYTGIKGGENPGQAFQTRFRKDQTSFQARTPTGDKRSPRLGRSRAGGGRASRNSDDSDSRRRKRGSEDGSNSNDRRGPKQEDWTEEEQQYLKERAERKSQKPAAYEPVEFGPDTFTGMVPATASDERGMSEMLGERLVLAKKFMDQEFIQWDSKEQRADVMALVEKLKAVREGRKANGNEEKAEEASSKSGDGDQQAQALMQKLFAGEYAKFKRLGESDVLGHVERYVHRNDSFYPEDEKSLLEKVRSMLPAEQASKFGREARKEVKA